MRLIPIMNIEKSYNTFFNHPPSNSLVQRVSATSKNIFLNLYSFFYNLMVNGARLLGISNLTKTPSLDILTEPSNAQIGALAMHSLFGISRYLDPDLKKPQNAFLVRYIANFANTIFAFSLLLSDKKALPSNIQNISQNLKITLISCGIFAGNISSKFRLRQSFRQLDIFITTTETAIIAYKTISELKKCWLSRKSKPLLAFKLTVIHSATLALNLYKLHQAIFNPFVTEIIPKDEIKKADDYYQYTDFRCMRARESELSPDFKERLKNLKLECPDQAVQVFDPSFNIYKTPLNEINRVYKKLKAENYSDLFQYQRTENSSDVTEFNKLNNAFETVSSLWGNYNKFKNHPNETSSVYYQEANYNEYDSAINYYNEFLAKIGALPDSDPGSLASIKAFEKMEAEIRKNMQVVISKHSYSTPGVQAGFLKSLFDFLNPLHLDIPERRALRKPISPRNLRKPKKFH